ncbi:MAG: hypothetical protein CM1200mP10_31640 [Candidatus Neomarinimicrobiota bacterium]|nr:MAG: hypothetical protein CM1200mP10_31640 [Candidatus Neomarinimicrobiota bacterium]
MYCRLGNGYDAVMFAQKGFEVTAVDFAPSAVIALEKMSNQEKVNVQILHPIFLT